MAPTHIWLSKLADNLGVENLESSYWFSGSRKIKTKNFWIVKDVKSSFAFYHATDSEATFKALIDEARAGILDHSVSLNKTEDHFDLTFTYWFLIEASDENLFVFKLSDLDTKNAKSNQLILRLAELLQKSKFQKYISKTER